MTVHELSDAAAAATAIPARSRLTKAQAVDLLAEAERSDVSLAAFARERGLVPNTLYNWRDRLRREGTARAGASAGAPLVNVTAAVTGDVCQPAVVFPNGVRLIAPQCLSAEQLRVVVHQDPVVEQGHREGRGRPQQQAQHGGQCDLSRPDS